MFASISKLFKRSEPGSVPKRASTAPANRVIRAAEGPYAQPESSAAQDAGDRLGVRFSTLIKALPEALHGKKDSADSVGGKFFISRQAVLDQLAKGSVRVRFGDLRRAAPPGIFTLSNTEDERMVELPLNELLPQLKPAEISRRTQSRVEVPEDISNLFDSKSEGLAGVRVMAKQEAGTTFHRKGPSTSQQQPEPEPVIPAPVAPAPATAARKAAPIPISARSAKPTKPAPAAPAPAVAPAASTRIAAPPGLAAAMAMTPTPAPTAPTGVSAGQKILSIKLTELAANWPENVQREIKTSSLINATCEIPAGELSKSMKQGRVELPWKQIRKWLNPPASGPSILGEMILQLPLDILAPIFLGQAPKASAQKKVEVAPEIPDIFSRGAPAPAAPPPPAAPVVQAPAPIPVPTPAPVIPVPVQAAAPARPRAETKAAPSSDTEIKTGPVPISLSLLASNWPSTLVKEFDTQFLAKGKLEIPVDALEPGMRSGKLDFPWKQLCNWLQPAAPPSLVAALSDSRLELPLSVVAPLFLQRRPQVPKRGSIQVDVPDVFSPVSEPAAPQPPSEPEERPFGAMIAAPSEAPGNTEVRRRVQDLADLFGQPEKRNWTPNEIVQNTSALPGVGGALIALQDGLLVASCMPPEWRTETIAAFLPQIFGRMNQYTKELKMGDLHSVNLAVEKGSLQIFAAGIIYFAVLSKPETTLPLFELTLIAKELSRHTK